MMELLLFLSNLDRLLGAFSSVLRALSCFLSFF